MPKSMPSGTGSSRVNPARAGIALVHTPAEIPGNTGKTPSLVLNQDQLQFLIIGAGSLGVKILNSLLIQSPTSPIRLVSTTVTDEVKLWIGQQRNVTLLERPCESEDLDDADLVIVAVKDELAGNALWEAAKAKKKLVHVVNDPERCDFYLNSQADRKNFPGVGKMHYAQRILAKYYDGDPAERRWKRIASYFLFAFFFMFTGHLLFSYFPFSDIGSMFREVDSKFYWMIGAGFLAQLVDGALGMGYGVTCATVLLSLGINLPAISGSIHTAEMFSSGVTGYSHFRFGNVNKKLFRTLLIPGIIGAVAGALLLSRFGDQYSIYFRPALAAYTLFLGAKIIGSALRKRSESKKVKRVGWLAGAGGFLDSFGGGGWGPLVTSTLISKGRSPRYVIGSVSVTEFFITLASALTFFSMLGISHWPVILGLMVGGTLAGPLAAKLAGRLPVKTMLIAVGTMVILWSLWILIRILFL